ncbi:MAG: 2,3-bisphosphoglycerate-independent phosphoglycerate mutase [Candidatus Limiplasma sp.]|nr:2,3-bisphosphoglycerate-independent phosphoglycerate mutase [Candidatus Limiplasma sp.]
MKYVLVIGDGMADTALGQLAGRTPLEALALPAFDRVAGCHCGRVLTVPQGIAPGSDTAILSIFGYDPRAQYTGRSVLEAAGMGVVLPAGSLSFRVNLCAVEPGDGGKPVIRSHNGGNIHGREALELMEALLADPAFAARMKEARMEITVTDTFRHIGVMKSDAQDLGALVLTEPHNVLDQEVEGHLPRLAQPTSDAATQRLREDLEQLMLLSYEALKDHPVNQRRREEGKLPASMIWPWGAATAMELASFEDKYGHGGSVISAVPLVWGIATLAGLKTPKVPGANGDLDTNYEGKADAALTALLEEGDDFAAVHVEAPDEMAHAGNLAGKLEAIQNIESRVVARLLDKLWDSGEDFRLLLLSDHPTLLTTRTHDGSPVPYAIYDSRTVRQALASGREEPRRKFCEKEFLSEPVLMEGTQLMPTLFEIRR